MCDKLIKRESNENSISSHFDPQIYISWHELFIDFSNYCSCVSRKEEEDERKMQVEEVLIENHMKYNLYRTIFGWKLIVMCRS